MQIRQGIRGWWIALAAALADRLTKVLVARFCPRGGAVIPGVLNLRPVENRGMAFSLLSGQSLLLTVFTALYAALACIWFWLIRRYVVEGPLEHDAEPAPPTPPGDADVAPLSFAY